MDAGPPGEAHSLTLPVEGSRGPTYPRAESVNQTLSFASMAMRRGRAAGSGRMNSRMAMVAGSTLPSLFDPVSAKKGTPLELTVIPSGSDFGVGDGRNVKAAPAE